MAAVNATVNACSPTPAWNGTRHLTVQYRSVKVTNLMITAEHLNYDRPTGCIIYINEPLHIQS